MMRLHQDTPMAAMVLAAKGTGDHDRRPADELDDIQAGKELGPLGPEGNADRFHGTAARPASDEAGQVHDDTADEMAQDDSRKGFGKAQRRQEHTRQDFGDGNAGAEP